MIVTGIYLSVLEVLCIFVIGYLIRNRLCRRLTKIDCVSYYWLLFTFITGIWEWFFLSNYFFVCDSAQNLLDTKSHVWTNNYSIINLLPNKFSVLFYSEYGAYADREYMEKENNWSRIIEGTHYLFCGIGACLCLVSKCINKKKYYTIYLGIAMSSQLMNSLLYIVNYFHETRDPYSINYNTPDFPTGFILNKRPFMYVNILWTVMPLYVLYREIVSSF